jgi:hypothetical protein
MNAAMRQYSRHPAIIATKRDGGLQQGLSQRFEPKPPVDASYIDIRDIAYAWINSRSDNCYYAKQLGAKFRT